MYDLVKAKLVYVAQPPLFRVRRRKNDVYYVQTEDPKYTPIWKLEPFKQAYKREASPFAFIYRLFGLKKKVTVEQLEEWQHLLYDSCTVCGRCSLICPMGIDIASMVSLARHGMFKAGLVPHELHAVAERAEVEGSPLGVTPKLFADRLEWMEDEHEVDINIDEDQADVLVVMSSIEIQKYPDSMAATAKILNAMGESWTFRTDGFEATNSPIFLTTLVVAYTAASIYLLGATLAVVPTAALVVARARYRAAKPAAPARPATAPGCWCAPARM